MSEQFEGTEQTKGWLKRYEKLKTARGVWDTAWQEIAEHIFPRKAGITQKDYTPNNNRDARLYDTTAMDSLGKSVAGYMSWTTNKTQPWFEFTPVLQQRRFDSVKNWLRECSMVSQEYIADSNFYTERHEYLNDVWGFGTGCMFVTVTPKGKTHFEKIKIGTYVFWQDENKQACGIIREIKFTAYQAARQFGAENLPKHIAEKLEKEPDTECCFYHVVEPRDESMRSNEEFAPAKRKAYLSCYFEKVSGKVMQEGGFDHFPFMIGRFLNWDALDFGDVWGYGPGFTLLPESRQLNFFRMMYDVFVEKKVFPPMAAPDTLEGSLKLAPRAMNYYGAGMQPDAIFPIGVTGDFVEGEKHIQTRKDMIYRLCHLDMFQMFAQIGSAGREITAFEASQLAGEKLDAISPAFDRDTGEFTTPMMTRLFDLWAENEMLPTPPQEAIQQVGPNLIQLPTPKVTMTSRLALALRSISLRSSDALINRIAMLAPVMPSIVDHVDEGFWVRESARLSGCDPQLLRPLEAVEAIQQQRAQAQQAQMAMMAAKEGAQAVKNIGGMEKAEQLLGAA
jgi:hypothetical protein